MKIGWRAIVFDRPLLPKIVSFMALNNHHSRAVMESIGMRNSGEDFKHPGVPEGRALRMHCFYRISIDAWLAMRRA